MPENDQQDPALRPHGLHTIHDLNWIGRMRLSLRRQSRKLYRSMRHPKHRRGGGIRAWLAKRVRNRNLWHPARHAVANGLACGLFFAMLPLPLQGLFAAVIGIARGWNVPAAIVATWLSNPFTYPLMAAASKGSIETAAAVFGKQAALTGVSLTDLAGSVFTADWTRLKGIVSGAGWGIIPEFLLGLVIVGILSAVVGWLLVHAIWPLLRKRPALVAVK